MTVEFKSSPLAIDKIEITSGFGIWRRYHLALDILAPPNTPVLAVADGRVFRVAYDGDGYGHYIVLKHDGFFTLYAHLSSRPSTTGGVTASRQIGLSGTTGRSTGPHLHLEVRQGDNFDTARKIDPTPFLTRVAQTSNVQVTRNSVSVYTPPTAEELRTAASREGRPSTANISPYIAATDSFHPKIQYELTRRNFASETANVYTPFVKLTSLSNVLSDNLLSGDISSFTIAGGDVFGSTPIIGVGDVYCPTLGPHGEPEISFEDIYTPQDGRSIVGYATKQVDGSAKRVPVVVANAEADPPNIPMPGIESVTTERSTAGPFGVRGGLFKANLKIVAHSVGQLNTLLRYFLRPATRVILEIGRKSSSNREQEINWFDWKQPREAIEGYLGPIVRMQTDQRELLTKYIYDNYGNYELFIGYVVNFKLKYGGKNKYEIDLTIHSVQQFEVPVKLTGQRSLCEESASDPCKVLDIVQYFDPNANWIGNSFGKLMAEVLNTNSDIYTEWNTHVIPLRGSGTDTAATAQPGYLVTWQFFTDVILNSEKYGLMSIFQLVATDTTTMELLKKSVLRKFQPDVDLAEQPRSLVNAQVSWHKALRSVDPGVMVIYNTDAQDAVQDRIRENLAKARVFGEAPTTTDDTVLNGIKLKGNFDKIGEKNISSLYKGVWINTNAIKEAFSSTDTTSAAIERLLNAMNSATQGFWNLQLLSNDQESPGVHVIDMGLSKPNNQPLKPQEDFNLTGTIDNRTEEVAKFQEGADVNKSQYLYMFNRKIRTFDTDDLGGELLDVSIEAGLPHVIAVQAIAGVGGVAQRGTMAAIDMDELRSITMFKDIYPNCNVSGSICPDPRDSLSAYAPSGLTFQQAINLATLVIRRKPDAIEADKTAISSGVAVVINNRPGRSSTPAPDEKLIKADIDRAIANSRAEFVQQNQGLVNLNKGFGNSFGSAITLIEWNVAEMLRLMEIAKEKEEIHPFNSSNLTKTVVDLTMPGIGGLQLFQAFIVDRVPNILDRGYFIVTKINHDFSVEKGWTTKIQGRFRFKPSKPETEPT